jgi:hypothetical protein
LRPRFSKPLTLSNNHLSPIEEKWSAGAAHSARRPLCLVWGEVVHCVSRGSVRRVCGSTSVAHAARHQLRGSALRNADAELAL